jgi:DNA-binding GntR family transcriptional regulator
MARDAGPVGVMARQTRRAVRASPQRAAAGRPTGGPHLSGLTASIVTTLKERIIAWEYPPEHRLTEEGLCAEFGVSRSPVREALRALVTGGFVAKLANRGYAVRQLDLREIEDLYDLRTALELYVVEFLARNGRAQPEVAALHQAWAEILAGPKRKGEELAELDTRFHETLAQAAGNRMLLDQLRAINERLFVFRMIDFGQPDRQQTTCRQHMKVIERILAGDVPGARAAMERNIGDGRANVDASIKEALARAFSVARPRAGAGVVDASPRRRARPA